MKKICFSILLLSILLSCKNSDKPIYLNPEQPIEKRVKDLMFRMTLEEKVGQMCQFVGPEHIIMAQKNITEEELKTNPALGFYPGVSIDDIKQMVREGKISSFLHVLNPEEANELQKLAQDSRLKIPLIIGIDAIHGNALVSGTTVYPTSIGQASMFDPDLVEEICRQTALEMRATGSQWTFNPNVEVARDPRWGRVGETFGEDPYLVSVLGAASVKGYQGKDFSKSGNVLACAKHFVAGSEPVNGVNSAPTDLSERTIREVFFPPFKVSLEAGVFSVMAAHNELNGIPCHSNKWLMTDVLRNEWDFKGFIVSDWMDVARIHDFHNAAVDFKEACLLSVEAGLDMHMHGPGFYENIIELVKEKKLSEKRIDDACRRILYAKFQLGLFENPFTNEKEASKFLFNEEHQKTALEAARKSIVLLTNNNILPIVSSKYNNVFVTGTNIDNQTILGDWAYFQPEENVTTVLEGLKEVSPQTQFTFLDQGWNLREMSSDKVTLAAKMAKEADLAIVVIGENSQRDNWKEKTCGEESDRSDINLVGLQEKLVRSVKSTGVPTIVVLVNGRQLGVEWIAENADALLEAWEPGSFGGRAIAEILYGRINPSGKLPVTIPRNAGQKLMVYNKKPSTFRPYTIGKSSPLFHFGYGLSYSKYTYSNLQCYSDKIMMKDSITVSVDVTNVSDLLGEEIVQLYIKDTYSSATRPVKELKYFKRIILRPAETQKVTFTLPTQKLAFYDKNMKWVVEPGEFKIMIGSSSRDEDLLETAVTVL